MLPSSIQYYKHNTKQFRADQNLLLFSSLSGGMLPIFHYSIFSFLLVFVRQALPPSSLAELSAVNRFANVVPSINRLSSLNNVEATLDGKT